MSLRDKIVELIVESGNGYVEKGRTIRTACPLCGQDDKFSILKENGACICYRGSCEFGKRWFDDWVALTFGIDRKDARDKIYASDKGKLKDPGRIAGLEMEVKFGDLTDQEDPLERIMSGIKPITFPEFHMVPLTDPDANEGVAYLQRRGVPLDVGLKYNVHYSKLNRRVYFPITINGIVYGYQGRHIDPVEDKMRMRNNEGFSREALVMFADNLHKSEFAIMAEGPFDALKFEGIGANICTMGKVVTDKQLEIIASYGITKIYLALDDDAAPEMMALVSKGGFSFWRVEVPESCKARCAAAGKKADFGECTMEEAKIAFDNAYNVDFAFIT